MGDDRGPEDEAGGVQVMKVFRFSLLCFVFTQLGFVLPAYSHIYPACLFVFVTFVLFAKDSVEMNSSRLYFAAVVT